MKYCVFNCVHEKYSLTFLVTSTSPVLNILMEKKKEKEDRSELEFAFFPSFFVILYGL